VSDTFDIRFLNVHRYTTFMLSHPSSSDTFMKASMETSRVSARNVFQDGLKTRTLIRGKSTARGINISCRNRSRI